MSHTAAAPGGACEDGDLTRRPFQDELAVTSRTVRETPGDLVNGDHRDLPDAAPHSGRDPGCYLGRGFRQGRVVGVTLLDISSNCYLDNRRLESNLSIG